MADIGTLLRETRMRKRIDISEIEAETKIRARYLRALENEEWDLLPGPTFVKTFLRTYAEYLGLDARAIVEDYKQRFERPQPEQIAPFSRGRRPGSGSGGGGRDRRRPPRQFSPLVVGAVVFTLLLGVLVLVSKLGEDESGRSGSAAATATATPQTAAERRAAARRERRARAAARRAERRREAAARRRTLTVSLSAFGPVNVCLVDAGGEKLIDNRVYDPGTRRRSYRSRAFKAWFGNGDITVKVGSRTFEVPDRSRPAGYRIGRTRLAALGSGEESPCG